MSDYFRNRRILQKEERRIKGGAREIIERQEEGRIKDTIRVRSANETRQLASYSNSTRSKLDLSELDSSSTSTRNVNESNRATRNSTQKTREKLENILYIKF